MKKIVVIGTGRMGGAFATAFAERTSHTVSIRGSHTGSSSAAAMQHEPLPEQHGQLSRTLKGHFAYFKYPTGGYPRSGALMARTFYL